MPRVASRFALFLTIPLVAVLLAGCSDHPGMGGGMSPRVQAADYPTLLPLSPLLSSIPATGEDFGIGTLAARASALRARAARLRRTVVDPATRARMQGALGRRTQ